MLIQISTAFKYTLYRTQDLFQLRSLSPSTSSDWVAAFLYNAQYNLILGYFF